MEIAILGILLAVVWYYGYTIKNSLAQVTPPDSRIDRGIDKVGAIEKHLSEIQYQLSQYARHHRDDLNEIGKQFERLGGLDYELRSIQEILSNIQHDLSVVVDHPAFTRERT